MKIKDSFVVHTVGNIQMMVDSDDSENKFDGLVRSNETAAFIISQLNEDKTEKDLVKALLSEYDVDEQTAEEAVKYVINKLKSINALE